jgi:Icc protein
MYTSNATSSQTLAAADPAVVRLVQFTDCHILAGAQDCLKGMNTRASFEAVCQAAMADPARLDLVLATGDLSQDASPASYQYLAQRFGGLQLPMFWLPGNHDDSNAMREHLRGELIFAAKQVLIGNWLIVLLDSTIAGETGGYLGPEQIDFLQASLQAHPQRHALVCLHHQPLATDSEWIDRLGLQQSQTLIDALKLHDNVRAVLWGHVHQQAHQRRDGIEWMSTPSTCIQFKPGSKTFALDDLPPGYRRLDLHTDGNIDTAVERLVDFAWACTDS